MHHSIYHEIAEQAARRDAPPLCVDLDGTLLHTDLLAESLVSVVFRRPALLLRLPGWLAGGKANLKARLADHAIIDPAVLPYDDRVLAMLCRERANGRRLILATAADRRLADAVAAHLGLFDDVVASDGHRNLKGAAKAQALQEAVGGPFSYAGNDVSDLDVWAAAESAVVVNASPALERKVCARHMVEEVIPPSGNRARALIKALRPHQWAKNILVFVPLVTANAMGDLAGWALALGAFLAFCATASGVYVLNDLSDLQADRAHPRKRRRPFASGALPVLTGLAAFPLLMMGGLALGWWLDILPIVAGYALLSTLYTFRIKELPLVDVFTLAALYTIRLFAGGEATDHHVSLWLLGFSGFLFLGLALIKRVTELAPLAGGGSLARRGYLAGDLPVLRVMGVASTFVSCIVLALYVQSAEVASRYASPMVLWGLVPLLLFWQCRLWLSTERGHMHDDPIVYSARDWVSWIVAGGCLLLLLAARASLT